MMLAGEVDAMARRLQQAGVEVLRALRPQRLAAMTRLAHDPHACTNLAPPTTVDPGREDG